MALSIRDITLSEQTLSDLKSVEYHWIRTLYVEGYQPEEINHYIRTCFGGDDTFADLLRKVALKQESLHTLLLYIGCGPSSHEIS